MNQARKMKKSLKAKENYKDFPKSYHGMLLSVILSEKIERDILSIKEQYNKWKYKSQVLLIKELEGVEEVLDNDISHQVPKEELGNVMSIANSLFKTVTDKNVKKDYSSQEESIQQLATEVYDKLVSSKAVDANDSLYLSLKNNDYILHKNNEKMDSYTLIYDEEDRKRKKILNIVKNVKRLIHKKTEKSLRFEKFYFIRWKITCVKLQISSLFNKLKTEYENYINIPITNKRILNVALYDDTDDTKNVQQIVN